MKIVSKSSLTHISLASFLWDIGKQNSPRCDAAKCGVQSGAILFAYIEKWNISPDAPKNESGLIQMIGMGKFIRHKWVKYSPYLFLCPLETRNFVYELQSMLVLSKK